jgi:UDP-glucose 4-epimerase
LQGICDKFLYQDFASNVALSWIISKQPDAIIHCAGTSLVGPSMQDPAEYYNNNVAKTLRLLDIVRKSLPRCRVIFSSSAATYGEPLLGECHEVDPCDPVSPYGQSKLMIDMILESYRKAYDLDYVSFRYFNACGADSQSRHGQEPGATHLIARFLEATRDDGNFKVYGMDYPTADGT